MKKKFDTDFRRASGAGFDGLVFVTNQELSVSQRAILSANVSGGTMIYHLERVVAVLDQPRMARVRQQFLALDERRDSAGGSEFFGLYQKAIDHLDSSRAHTRLGGLRVLSALGQDYRGQRQTVVDAICGYLRTPWDSNDRSEAEVRRSALGILAGHLRPFRGEDSLPQSTSFWEGVSVDLVGAVLHEARFDGCEFAAADFERATFIGSTGFRGAHFLGTARFVHATFGGWWADFRGATFSGVTWFRWVNFTVNALFGSARFRLNAEFSRAQFGEDADFTGVEVGQVGWFTHNIFHGSALFRDARFKFANYWCVDFEGHVDFAGARFTGAPPGCVEVRYQDTQNGHAHCWPEGWINELRSLPSQEHRTPPWW
ncbi:pentapeptide repeat-containing protein [Saccharopolyspora sp. ID03-671]|uniref:pentapeptide repeat-containing protein n=1 Tax=Saccharopolyspora sp. ID03-671 TaxID=3073066 RepID=UPI00324FF059